MARLTPKQQRFVDEYLIDLNGTQAAIRAKYSAKSAGRFAQELLLKPHIQNAIREAQQKRSERTEITQDIVLQRLWDIATANPNEVVQFRRVNCRYCWGEDHQYQWTDGEYISACRFAEQNEMTAPKSGGGFDFDKTRSPHPDCPECKGEGHGEIHIADTSKLTGAAALLYAGAKAGKFGIEVQLHDQMSALVRVGQHIGMFKNQHEHTGKNGEPIQTANLNVNMTEQEANQRITELLGKLGFKYAK